MREMLILAGPSGVGKTTLAELICALSGGRFDFLRSATTRKPRGDEHDAEYLYLSREDFLARVESGLFLEYMEYGGELYGTPVSELERVFSAGKTPLLVLDITGVESVKAKAEALSLRPFGVYMYADLALLRARLGQRNTPAESRIRRNLADYLDLPNHAVAFDLVFPTSDGSPERDADTVLAAFDLHCEEKYCSDAQKIKAIAESLAAAAERENILSH